MSTLEERAARAGADREASMEREKRRARGVVHTPAVVARWALSRVDACLRSAFELSAGIGDERVVLCDPALGTGVWLAAAMSLVERRAPVTAVGIDIDAAALASAEGLLRPRAVELGWSLQLREGNALEEAAPFVGHDGVRVIVGNPPWAARSQSRGSAVSDNWLRDFRLEADGSALREQRSGVLSDDYVRFFGWALEQARTAERGAIVCFATNHSYLDGPVHRGMRRALCTTFDRIEVVDLGGNALIARGEQRDENVFGVRVGAALTMAVRLPGHRERTASVECAKLRGKKADKLVALSSGEPLRTTSFKPLAPRWLFVPQQARDDRDTFSIAAAFPFHREGIQTNRDALCVDVDRDALLDRLWRFARGELPVEASRHFDPALARARLLERLTADPFAAVTEFAYRPLDTRFVCTVAPVCHRPRLDLLEACKRSSLCLSSARKDRGSAPWSLLGVARHAADSCFLSTRSSCRTRVWPNLLADGSENLEPRVAARLSDIAGVAMTSELAMAYVCGALISPRYRAEHSDALKRDYPEVPWPRDAEAFTAFVAAGRMWIGGWLRPVHSAASTADANGASAPHSVGRLETLHTLEHSGRPDLTIGHFRLRALIAARTKPHLGDLEDAYERALIWDEAGQLADIAHLKNGSV